MKSSVVGNDSATKTSNPVASGCHINAELTVLICAIGDGKGIVDY